MAQEFQFEVFVSIADVKCVWYRKKQHPLWLSV